MFLSESQDLFWVTLVETALKWEEDGKKGRDILLLSMRFISLGHILTLHLRIEREATTFKTAGYINNTAEVSFLQENWKYWIPQILAQTTNN
jgi:hypothetical protein